MQACDNVAAKREALMQTVKEMPSIRKDARIGATEALEILVKEFADVLCKQMATAHKKFKGNANNNLDMVSFQDMTANRDFIDALKRSGCKTTLAWKTASERLDEMIPQIKSSVSKGVLGPYLCKIDVSTLVDAEKREELLMRLMEVLSYTEAGEPMHPSAVGAAENLLNVIKLEITKHDRSYAGTFAINNAPVIGKLLACLPQDRVSTWISMKRLIENAAAASSALDSYAAAPGDGPQTYDPASEARLLGLASALATLKDGFNAMVGFLPKGHGIDTLLATMLDLKTSDAKVFYSNAMAGVDAFLAVPYDGDAAFPLALMQVVGGCLDGSSWHNLLTSPTTPLKDISDAAGHSIMKITPEPFKKATETLHAMVQNVIALRTRYDVEKNIAWETLVTGIALQGRASQREGALIATLVKHKSEASHRLKARALAEQKSIDKDVWAAMHPALHNLVALAVALETLD
jgi:hypothetical protein